MHAVPEGVHDLLFKTSSAGFTSAQRLLRVDGFDAVINSERRTNKYFKIYFALNDREHARLGMVSSKKILPRAVDRNCAKRLIRETFRHHNIKISKLDMVIMLRPAYAQKTSLLKKELVELLSKIEKNAQNSN